LADNAFLSAAATSAVAEMRQDGATAGKTTGSCIGSERAAANPEAPQPNLMPVGPQVFSSTNTS
jgi:hypothetical protein